MASYNSGIVTLQLENAAIWRIEMMQLVDNRRYRYSYCQGLASPRLHPRYLNPAFKTKSCALLRAFSKSSRANSEVLRRKRRRADLKERRSQSHHWYRYAAFEYLCTVTLQPLQDKFHQWFKPLRLNSSSSPSDFLCPPQWDLSPLHTFFGALEGYVNKEPRHLWRKGTFNTRRHTKSGAHKDKQHTHMEAGKNSGAQQWLCTRSAYTIFHHYGGEKTLNYWSAPLLPFLSATPSHPLSDSAFYSGFYFSLFYFSPTHKFASVTRLFWDGFQ